MLADFLRDGEDIGFFHDSHSFEFVSVFIECLLLAANDLVHKWVGEKGLIQLVMTMTSVSNNVNEYVLTELSTIVGSQATDPVYLFRLICVHMNYRGKDSLGHLGGVES